MDRRLAGQLFYVLFYIKNTTVNRKQSGYLGMKMPIFVILEPFCQMLNPNAVLSCHNCLLFGFAVITFS